MTDSRPRLVLDTHVWLDLLHFDDPQCAALARAIDRRQVRVLSRVDVRDEFRRVLGYPALAIAEARQPALLAAFDARVDICPLIDIEPLPLPRCRDPDDQKFLELARDGRAHALLTRDAELLRLAARCRRAFGFAIVPPARFELTGVLGQQAVEK